MGIPYYFRQIVRSNKELLGNKPPRCNRLYLDFNSVIHMCSQKVVAQRKPCKDLETDIFDSIIEQTYNIVSYCPPDQLLYIGVDGVAPLAKMVQQRKRRHMSSMQNALINDFKRKHNIPVADWDSNCITPGTPFMARLQKYLESHFKSTQLPYEVYVSGPDQEGEGEHKIIKYIKSLGDKDPFVDVIYGLDADLIMLALTCSKPNIYLMRETSQVLHNAQQMTGFKYLNIDKMRKAVAFHLYGVEDQSFMLDYVCICFILGNDFLPHNMSYDIKHQGLEALCSVYKRVHQETGQFLINHDGAKYNINPTFFSELFQCLALDEEQRFKTAIQKHYDESYLPVNNGRTPLEKFMFDMNNTPLYKKHKLIDPSLDPFWKSTYYKMFHNITPQNIKGMDALCLCYIDGIYWNVDYYFNNIFNHGWYYKYNVAPFLSDIVKYMKKTSYTHFNHVSSETITPIEQLMMVLPFQSHKLLPEDVQKTICNVESGIVHLYPQKFQTISFLKSQLWECIPILPKIDLPAIRSYLIRHTQLS